MLVGEELWAYLEERGVKRHKHSNGLMSCVECSRIVVTGKTVQELREEDEELYKRLWREMGLDKPE